MVPFMVTDMVIAAGFRPGAAFVSAVYVSAQGFDVDVRICERYCPAVPTAVVSVS